jgi:hypothetical protein
VEDGLRGRKLEEDVSVCVDGIFGVVGILMDYQLHEE